MTNIPKEILDILACPICKNGIRVEDDKLVCDHCRKIYPIIKQKPSEEKEFDTPVLLIEKAEDF